MTLKALNIRNKRDLQLFATSYNGGDGFYGAEIEAADIDHARTLAAQRGLGERIEGLAASCWTGKIGRLIDEGAYVAAAHEAAFLCFVGLSSGAITAREALSDEGLVHSLLHLAAGDPHKLNAQRTRCKRLAVAFANRIPGYPVHDWPAPAFQNGAAAETLAMPA